MLHGIDPLITPELLHTLARMGHGDRLAIVDRNYPAYRHPLVHPLAGTDTATATRAILTLLPVDDFVDPVTWRMTPQDDTAFRSPSHDLFDAAVSAAAGRSVQAAALPRFDYYAAAESVFAVVATTDTLPYSCFIVTKGVI